MPDTSTEYVSFIVNRNKSVLFNIRVGAFVLSLCLSQLPLKTAQPLTLSVLALCSTHWGAQEPQSHALWSRAQRVSCVVALQDYRCDSNKAVSTLHFLSACLLWFERILSVSCNSSLCLWKSSVEFHSMHFFWDFWLRLTCLWCKSSI